MQGSVAFIADFWIYRRFIADFVVFITDIGRLRQNFCGTDMEMPVAKFLLLAEKYIAEEAGQRLVRRDNASAVIVVVGTY